MNHGSDSRYTISSGSGEVFLRRTWRPPRSCPWPVSQRETVNGGDGGAGKVWPSSNETRTSNGSSTIR